MTNYMINYMINYDKLLYDKLLTGLISTGALAEFWLPSTSITTSLQLREIPKIGSLEKNPWVSLTTHWIHVSIFHIFP